MLWLICCRSPCGSVDLNDIPVATIRNLDSSLPLWERGFKQPNWFDTTMQVASLPLWERKKKSKNAIERADQGSFYFSLFSQFYMHQTNKLRKEKSKNSLKYNYEKGENK